MTVTNFTLYHTSETLRAHRLLLKQVTRKGRTTLTIVDWKTYRPASKARINRWLAEESE